MKTEERITSQWSTSEFYREFSTCQLTISEALVVLDCIRPHNLNLPYYACDAVLRRHQGTPMHMHNPNNVAELARVVTSEFLDMMETFVVPESIACERITLQSKTCMTILYELYISPYIEQKMEELCR